MSRSFLRCYSNVRAVTKPNAAEGDAEERGRAPAHGRVLTWKPAPTREGMKEKNQTWKLIHPLLRDGVTGLQSSCRLTDIFYDFLFFSWVTH